MYEEYKTKLASVIRSIGTTVTSSLLCEGLI